MTLDGDKKGTHYNCECPHCGKNNVYVTQDDEVPLKGMVILSKSCFHCGNTIFYQAQREIIVIASTEHPIDRLREKPREPPNNI